MEEEEGGGEGKVDTGWIQGGYSEDTGRIQWFTIGIQWGYSYDKQGYSGVQSGYSHGAVGVQ